MRRVSPGDGKPRGHAFLFGFRVTSCQLQGNSRPPSGVAAHFPSFSVCFPGPKNPLPFALPVLKCPKFRQTIFDPEKLEMSKNLHIGSLQLNNNLILAPMAGITNLPMRLMARECGAALCFTEMVSVNGLVREGQKDLRTAAQRAGRPAARHPAVRRRPGAPGGRRADSSRGTAS